MELGNVNVAALLGGNATGEKFPPFIVFKEKHETRACQMINNFLVWHMQQAKMVAIVFMYDGLFHLLKRPEKKTLLQLSYPHTLIVFFNSF